MKTDRWVVDPVSGCWLWTLHIDANGYGKTWWNGKTGAPAHHWAYETHIGPIPAGMTVDHLCFQPACVNPSHLRLLTKSENSKNQRSAFKTHCVHGHEFTPENTYQRPNRHGREGKRSCRACNTAAVARYRAKKDTAA